MLAKADFRNDFCLNFVILLFPCCYVIVVGDGRLRVSRDVAAPVTIDDCQKASPPEPMAMAFSLANTRLVPVCFQRPAATALHSGWTFLTRTGLFVPVLYFLFLLRRAPHVDPQDWDYDEGINLNKALLLRDGFTLYSDIWSDQPPLLTGLLAGWAALFGESVTAARLLIMLFAALLVWMLYLAARSATSTAAAVVAVVMLILSEFFLRLSGAVMVGLPALALAMTAAAILAQGERTWWRLVAAAPVMAAALQIKLISALVGPAIVVHLLWGPAGAAMPSFGRRLLRAAAFGVLTLVVFVLIALPFNAVQPGLLLGTHFGAPTYTQAMFLEEKSTFLPNFFKQHVAYLLVGLVGVLWAARRRDRSLLLPLTWFMTTLAALTVHRPLWYHHTIMLSVPLAWVCAYGVQAWVAQFDKLTTDQNPTVTKTRAGFLVTAAVALTLALLLLPRPLEQRQHDQMRINRPNYIPHIFQRFSEHAAVEPGWVFTDHPFYAYQAGLPVPPPIAAISRKRLETGIITQGGMVATLEEYWPKYVILERFTHTYSEEFMQILREKYDLVVEIEPAQYYRLNGAYTPGPLPEAELE